MLQWSGIERAVSPKYVFYKSRFGNHDYVPMPDHKCLLNLNQLGDQECHTYVAVQIHMKWTNYEDIQVAVRSLTLTQLVWELPQPFLESVAPFGFLVTYLTGH